MFIEQEMLNFLFDKHIKIEGKMRVKLLNLISSFLMNSSSSFLLFDGANADGMSASFNALDIAKNKSIKAQIKKIQERRKLIGR